MFSINKCCYSGQFIQPPKKKIHMQDMSTRIHYKLLERKQMSLETMYLKEEENEDCLHIHQLLNWTPLD